MQLIPYGLVEAATQANDPLADNARQVLFVYDLIQMDMQLTTQSPEKNRLRIKAAEAVAYATLVQAELERRYTDY